MTIEIENLPWFVQQIKLADRKIAEYHEDGVPVAAEVETLVSYLVDLLDIEIEV